MPVPSIIDPFYKFPWAARLAAVELSDSGSVRPFMMERNTSDVLVPSGPAVQPVALKPGDTVSFTVAVPNNDIPGNTGIMSIELADWGPQDYLFTNAAFIGTTWPFGQEFPVGPSPGTAHVDGVNFTFAQNAAGQWSLNWQAVAGPTVQTCSLNVVPKGGGSKVYVVLRLAGDCVGGLQFKNVQFGPGNQTDFVFTVANVAVQRQASPLSVALSELYNTHNGYWEAAKKTGIPDDFLEPIRRGIFERLQNETVALLDAQATVEKKRMRSNLARVVEIKPQPGKKQQPRAVAASRKKR